MKFLEIPIIVAPLKTGHPYEEKYCYGYRDKTVNLNHKMGTWVKIPTEQ